MLYTGTRESLAMPVKSTSAVDGAGDYESAGDVSFVVGDRFNSFDSLQSKIKAYE